MYVRSGGSLRKPPSFFLKYKETKAWKERRDMPDAIQEEGLGLSPASWFPSLELPASPIRHLPSEYTPYQAEF